MSQRELDDRRRVNLQSPPGSSKGVLQKDQRNAPSSFMDLNVSVDSSTLSPRRDRFEKPIKVSPLSEEESTTYYYLLLERLK